MIEELNQEKNSKIFKKKSWVSDTLLKYTEKDLNHHLTDEESFTWPILPEEVKEYLEKEFKKEFEKGKIHPNIAKELILKLGYQEDHIDIFLNIFEEERKLNEEKELSFTWDKFKDLLGTILVDTIQLNIPLEKNL